MIKVRIASYVILLVAIINFILPVLIFLGISAGYIDFNDSIYPNNIVYYFLYKLIIYLVILIFLIFLKKEFGQENNVSSVVAFLFLGITIIFYFMIMISAFTNPLFNTSIGALIPISVVHYIEVFLNIPIMIMIADIYKRGTVIISTMAIIVVRIAMYPVIGGIAFILFLIWLPTRVTSLVNEIMGMWFSLLSIEAFVLLAFAVFVFKGTKKLTKEAVIDSNF
ncbi:MAG: hypothetical protein ACOX4W_02915 [Bacilli bacterium]